MKYLNKFNIINEDFVSSLIDKLDYKREEDIRDCFIELLDMGLSEDYFYKKICDSNFREKNKWIYNPDYLYPTYKFILRSRDESFNSDYTVELMQNITESLERLKGNGYKVNIDELKILSSSRKNGKLIIIYEFSVYHPDDKIPLDMIYSSEDDEEDIL